jgi:hypothetical protein
MGTFVVVGEEHAGPNDCVYTRVVDSPSGTKFLCVVWHDPDDPDNEPTVTLWGPHLTDEDCREQFRRMSKHADDRKVGDWTTLPEASRLLINARIQQGLDRLAAH